MLRRITVLRRENVDHGNRITGKVLERGRERSSAGEKLTLAFRVAAFADGADIPPQYGLVGYGGLLEGRKFGPLEIVFDLIVFHTSQ